MGITIVTRRMVGNSIGENRPKDGKKKAKVALIYCVVMQSSLVVLFFLFKH